MTLGTVVGHNNLNLLHFIQPFKHHLTACIKKFSLLSHYAVCSLFIFVTQSGTLVTFQKCLRCPVQPMLIKTTIQFKCSSCLLGPIFMFLVRQRPLVALVIITAAMEDIRWRSTKKDKGHSMRREGWMVGLNFSSCPM